MFGKPTIIRPSASVSIGVVGPRGASLIGFPRLPLVTDGNEGDYFIDLTAGDVRLYGPKTSGIWPSSYLSLVGPQGSPGPQILSGGGAPTQLIGNSGDYYLDIAASIFYGPKTTGQWPTPGVSLVGNTGQPGPATTLTIGSVTQLAPGAPPTVTVTGTSPNQSVSFGIPQGQPGASGNGTGNVNTAGSAISGHVVRYSDATGTYISDAGIPPGATLLPPQTKTQASYTFAAADLYQETRRTNAGAAMADTLPPSNTVGLLNGTTIQINNSDATATLTLSPGSGTTIVTAGGTQASIAVGPTRSTLWTYDLANTAWRPTMNSLTTALLASPAFTGTPTAPTPAAGDISQALATTGFVAAALGTAASDTRYNSQDIRALYLILSGQTGADRLNGVATITDGFNDQSDVATITGATYDGTNHRYSVTNPGYFPKQTAAQAIGTAPYSASYPLSNAFDGSSTTYFATSNAGVLRYAGQDFGSSPQSIRQVVLTNATVGSQAPASVAVEYSDDNSTWTIATTSSVNVSANIITTIAVPESGAHRYWRTSNSPSTASPSTYWYIAELTFSTYVSGTGMVLQSAAFPSDIVSPSKGRVLVQVDGTSATFTPNTDLIASVSRDGGTTFTAGTLAYVETLADGTKTYETGLIDMTSTPAGSSMVWKVVTANSKNIVVSGVVLQWRP